MADLPVEFRFASLFSIGDVYRTKRIYSPLGYQRRQSSRLDGLSRHRDLHFQTTFLITARDHFTSSHSLM